MAGPAEHTSASQSCGSGHCLLEGIEKTMTKQHEDTKETMRANHQDTQDFIEKILDLQATAHEREIGSLRADVTGLRGSLGADVTGLRESLSAKLDSTAGTLHGRITALELENMMIKTKLNTELGDETLAELVSKQVGKHETVSRISLCINSWDAIRPRLWAAFLIAAAIWVFYAVVNNPVPSITPKVGPQETIK